MTIVEAIKEVLKAEASGLTCQEIHDRILERELYAFKAVNPVSVVNSEIRRHCEGLDFPTASPVKYFSIADYLGKKPKYILKINKTLEKATANVINSTENLPEEKIQVEYQKHVASIRTQLIEILLEKDPAFFEQLIVDLLLAMDYGYDKSSGVVIGGSHDGGIDGVIYEDKLGLSKIYLQAKRYSNDNTIGRKEIQAFVGAMESVQKGVFITTSSFTKEAIGYAESQQQKNIRLIDGNRLSELLVKYKIGVHVAKTLFLYGIDESYFNQY